MEISSFLVRALVGVGALSAGVGIFTAGMRLGRFLDRHTSRVVVALEGQTTAQQGMSALISAELAKQNQVITLLESVHRDREEIGVTLRTISRKLNQVLADSNAQEVE